MDLQDIKVIFFFLTSQVSVSSPEILDYLSRSDSPNVLDQNTWIEVSFLNYESNQ